MMIVLYLLYSLIIVGMARSAYKHSTLSNEHMMCNFDGHDNLKPTLILFRPMIEILSTST